MPTYRGRRVYQREDFQNATDNFRPTPPFTSDMWDEGGKPKFLVQSYLGPDATRHNHRMDESLYNRNYDARYFGLMGWPTAVYTPTSGWDRSGD